MVRSLADRTFQLSSERKAPFVVELWDTPRIDHMLRADLSEVALVVHHAPVGDRGPMFFLMFF